MNAEFAVVKIGGKARVVNMAESLAHPGCKVSQYSTIPDFKAFHNKRRKLVVNDDGEEEKIGLGTWWIKNEERRQYDGIVYAPGASAKPPRGKLNLWTGFGCKAAKGGFRRFLKQLYTNVCSGNKDHHLGAIDALLEAIARLQAFLLVADGRLNSRASRVRCGPGGRRAHGGCEAPGFPLALLLVVGPRTGWVELAHSAFQ